MLSALASPVYAYGADSGSLAASSLQAQEGAVSYSYDAALYDKEGGKYPGVYTMKVTANPVIPDLR